MKRELIYRCKRCSVEFNGYWPVEDYQTGQVMRRMCVPFNSLAVNSAWQRRGHRCETPGQYGVAELIGANELIETEGEV
jgi:hypothetical protein